ncbi:MAG: hypothetical protein Q7U16_13400, partial [Agitococcus sp.]|nr:hypothetical protein [Agitococcus sp.]
ISYSFEIDRPSGIGRSQLFGSFKKPISIPAIHTGQIKGWPTDKNRPKSDIQRFPINDGFDSMSCHSTTCGCPPC